MHRKTSVMNVAFATLWTLAAVFEVYVVYSYMPLIPLFKMLVGYVFVIAIAFINAIALKKNSVGKLNVLAQLSSYCLIAVIFAATTYIFFGSNTLLVDRFKSEYLAYVLMFVLPALINIKALRAIRNA